VHGGPASKDGRKFFRYEKNLMRSHVDEGFLRVWGSVYTTRGFPAREGLVMMKKGGEGEIRFHWIKKAR